VRPIRKKKDRREMGYNTEFKGILRFTESTPIGAISDIQKLIDIGETPAEYGSNYIDIRIAFESDIPVGIEWNDECEKTYGMVETVNFIIDSVSLSKPGFGLDGTLFAQGEELGDVWILRIVDGKAVREEVGTDNLHKCPLCGHKWRG
jgi:hypothetical protein